MSIENWSEEITVVELQDDPTFSDDIAALREQLTSKPANVVLNFAGMSFLNSSNLASLVDLRKQLHSQHKRLVLCGIDMNVWGLFMVTGLDKVFSFEDNVALGLASLQIGNGPGA